MAMDLYGIDLFGVQFQPMWDCPPLVTDDNWTCVDESDDTWTTITPGSDTWTCD